MPDQQPDRGGNELPPSVPPDEPRDDADASSGGLPRPEPLSVALFVFFIALLLVVAAMTLLPVFLR